MQHYCFVNSTALTVQHYCFVNIFRRLFYSNVLATTPPSLTGGIVSTAGDMAKYMIGTIDAVNGKKGAVLNS